MSYDIIVLVIFSITIFGMAFFCRWYVKFRYGIDLFFEDKSKWITDKEEEEAK
jgi:hypothetical protein